MRILKDISLEIKVLKVIRRIRESFPGAESVYSQGSCIKFAMILQEIYPSGQILYDSDHAIFELNGCYYDIKGHAVKSDNHIPLNEYGLNEIYDLMSLSYPFLSDM